MMAMKRTIRFVLGFALLGALIGVCLPLFLERRDSMTYGFPYWVDVSPLVAVLVLSMAFGLFLGALTGLASAFTSGRFATVRCLLTISIPSFVAMAFSAPPSKQGWFWTPYVVGAVVAPAIAILLAYLGHRRMRQKPSPIPPTPPAR